MRTNLRKRVSMLLAVVMCVTTLVMGTGTAAAAYFVDVSDSDWFAPVVNAMAEGGLISGVGDNSFAPNANMSLAAFSTITCRAAGLSTDSGSNSYWGYGAVKQCLDAGYIANHGDITSANYDQAITREEAIAGMTKMEGLTTKVPDKTWTLADIPDGASISANYRDAIVKAYNMGITSGMDPQGSFCPQSNMTRAQVAQLFYNMGITKAKPVTPEQPVQPSEYKAPVGFVFSDSLWKTHEKATYTDGNTYTAEYVALLEDNAVNGVHNTGSAFVSRLPLDAYEEPITLNFDFKYGYIDPATGLETTDEDGPTHIKIVPEVNVGSGWVPVGEYVFDSGKNLTDGAGTLKFTIPFYCARYSARGTVRFVLYDGYSMNTGWAFQYNGFALEYDPDMVLDPDNYVEARDLGTGPLLPLQ